MNTQDNNKNYSILYADDYENNVLIIDFYLKSQFYNLDIATNGQEAVDKYKEKHYDLILMDIQMPIMDGLEATKIIRELEKESGKDSIPIIAVTAYSMEENRVKALDAGCDFFVTKPVNKKNLLAMLEDILSD